MGFQFHETVRGAKFFDGQVPKLIRSLESIATSLEKLARREDEKEQKVKEILNKKGISPDEVDAITKEILSAI